MKQNFNKILISIINDDFETLNFYLEMYNSFNIFLTIDFYDIPPILKDNAPLIAYSIFFESKKCINLLLSFKENLIIKDLNGRMPHHFCVCFNDLNTLISLIKLNVNIFELDYNNKNLLHYSILFERINIIKWSLLNNYFDINSIDIFGNSCLHFAIQTNNYEIITLLLQNNILHEKNKKGWSPLLYSIKYKNLQIIDLLIKNGGDIFTKNNEEDNCLHISCFYDEINILKYFLSLGLNINSINKNGQTPLIIAIIQNNISIVEFLLNNGSNVNNYGNISFFFFFKLMIQFYFLFNWAPIHYVSYYGYEEILNLLINFNENLNLKDNDQNTPLHIAIKKNNLKIVEILLKNGVKKNLKNFENCTPKMLAKKSNNLPILELFKTKFENYLENNNLIYRNKKFIKIPKNLRNQFL